MKKVNSIEEGKLYCALVCSLRGCSGKLEDDGRASFKYLYSYDKAKDKYILLKCIKTNDGFYVKEYYTNSIIKVVDDITKNVVELPEIKIDSIENLEMLNELSSLGIEISSIFNIDDEFKKEFYKNSSDKVIDEIIKTIEHINNRGEESKKSTIGKMIRKKTFDDYEYAYTENIMYDMEHGIEYKNKVKEKNDN